MDKDFIISAFRDSISHNEKFHKEIYGELPLPGSIEDTVLALSSLSFVELLIDVEERIDFEFAEDCMTSSKVKISELIEIIAEKYHT